MSKKIAVCVLCALSVTVALVSCASKPVPITPELVNTVGVDNLSQYYYYLSKDVTLELIETVDDGVRFEDGKSISLERTVAESVLIKKTTPGVAVKNMPAHAAYVAFNPTPEELKVTVERNGQMTGSYDLLDQKSGVSPAEVFNKNPSISYRLLSVAFEEGEGREIGFAVIMDDNQGYFELLFDNAEGSLILYDGKMYKVVYKGEERPYLMVVTGKGAEAVSSKKRTASGRKI